jgi:transcriptional regulator GlxA family with amidase domain
MHAFSDKLSSAMQRERLILFVVYPGIKLLDISGPLQVFVDTRSLFGNMVTYRTCLASLTGGLVKADTMTELGTSALDEFADAEIDTLLVCGGPGVHTAAEDTELTKRIRQLALRARRYGSVCTGAFLLGQSGLLDGKRVTTHWEACGRLAQQFPTAIVESDPIFVNDGAAWSSAGVTAGIDLALAMVASDYGRKTALEVARSLVTFMVRPGDQSQFSSALALQISDADGRFGRLHDWIFLHVQEDLSVEMLARQANMELRTFHRQYYASTGMSPAKAVETIRMEAALRLIEEPGISLAQIAVRCGFKNPERFRRAFIRATGTAPDEYRKSLRPQPPMERPAAA